MTRIEFKLLVQSLRMPDEKLGHAYERVSRSFGFKDWNTMSATYPWSL